MVRCSPSKIPPVFKGIRAGVLTVQKAVPKNDRKNIHSHAWRFLEPNQSSWESSLMFWYFHYSMARNSWTLWKEGKQNCLIFPLRSTVLKGFWHFWNSKQSFRKRGTVRVQKGPSISNSRVLLGVNIFSINFVEQHHFFHHNFATSLFWFWNTSTAHNIRTGGITTSGWNFGGEKKFHTILSPIKMVKISAPTLRNHGRSILDLKVRGASPMDPFSGSLFPHSQNCPKPLKINN